MSRKVIVAIMVISLMASTVAQARLISRSQQLQPHQMPDPINAINVPTVPYLPGFHAEFVEFLSPDILIVAGRRERREIRRKIKRHFKRKERRERRKRIGGAIVGGIIAGAIIAEKKRKERRREVIEHHHHHYHDDRPRRDYDY